MIFIYVGSVHSTTLYTLLGGSSIFSIPITNKSSSNKDCKYILAPESRLTPTTNL